MLGPKIPLVHYPADQWQTVMQTNVNAVFMLNQGLFDLLDQGDPGCVIHVSSSVGIQGRAYWGAYPASKFALEGLSQILADETETAGKIRVYSVNPGALAPLCGVRLTPWRIRKHYRSRKNTWACFYSCW